jgi:hypothetical protein
MNGKERVKAELQALIHAFDGLDAACEFTADGIFEFAGEYQAWYTKGLKMVEALARDRLDEFRSLYEAEPGRTALQPINYSLQDFVRGISPQRTPEAPPSFDVTVAARMRLYSQFHILRSLSSRVDGVLADVEGFLQSQLEDDELAAAEKIAGISHRAAGAIAGVVLERHLQRVADNHGVKIERANPTVADLNDPLRGAGVYDLPTWRKIQHLADLRNLCAHQKQRDPTEAEVTDLLSGVKSVIAHVV